MSEKWLGRVALAVTTFVLGPIVALRTLSSSQDLLTTALVATLVPATLGAVIRHLQGRSLGSGLRTALGCAVGTSIVVATLIAVVLVSLPDDFFQ